MSKKRKVQAREETTQITILVRAEVMEEIRTMAAAERRSMSNMIDLLLHRQIQAEQAGASAK